MSSKSTKDKASEKEAPAKAKEETVEQCKTCNCQEEFKRHQEETNSELKGLRDTVEQLSDQVRQLSAEHSRIQGKISAVITANSSLLSLK